MGVNVIRREIRRESMHTLQGTWRLRVCNNYFCTCGNRSGSVALPLNMRATGAAHT